MPIGYEAFGVCMCMRVCLLVLARMRVRLRVCVFVSELQRLKCSSDFQ
jgi:hypothetical protein